MKTQTVIKYLIIINVLVYAVEVGLAHSFNISPQVALSLGANYAPAVAAGQYYRLVTAMFVHFSLIHLVSNMLGLYWYGQTNLYRAGQLLIIYFGSGLGGNILSALKQPQIVAAGASTAIMGLIGALLALTFSQQVTNKGNLFLNSILLLLVNTVGMIGTNVDIYGHLGGAITGFLLGSLFVCWNNRHPQSLL